jgi:hypothetical protein
MDQDQVAYVDVSAGLAGQPAGILRSSGLTLEQLAWSDDHESRTMTLRMRVAGDREVGA